MTPEVMDVLESCKIALPTEFYSSDAKTAMDMNKCYANILKKGDKYGWGRFMATDEIEPFDGKIQCGLYYVITDDDVLFRGNNWYSDNIVNKAIIKDIIKKKISNIKLKHLHYYHQIILQSL